MRSFIKENIVLIVIILAASFFYIFRLHQTFVMATDTARDLVRVLQIWQNKEITMIGPPVNTISDNPIHVFFGSFYYYFGLIGLIIFKFDPVGSVFLNILLTIISIPFFYLLSKELLKRNNLALLATVIYSLSPVTVASARSYWNPNLIVPLSVFTWFCFLYKRSYLKYFLAGILTGIIFNLHYVDFFPIGLYIFFLLFRKDKKYLLLTIFGFVLAMSPFIAFELKNHFFLIKAFFLNSGGFSTFKDRVLNPFLSIDAFLYIFGFGPMELYLPGQFIIPVNYRILIDSAIGILFIYFMAKGQKIFNKELTGVIFLGLFIAWYLQKLDVIYMRYILSVYPLLIISAVALLAYLSTFSILILIIPMLILSIKIITHKLDPNIREDYYPLNMVEVISKTIVADNPTGKYNITENILGDAQSLAFRYYLLRDAPVKPQPVEIYDRINTLYVITPSLDKTYKDNRWEFSASGPKKIAWEKDFGELKLFKFVK